MSENCRYCGSKLGVESHETWCTRGTAEPMERIAQALENISEHLSEIRKLLERKP